MKILISPAKSLDYENEVETSHSSKPLFGIKAKQINNVIKDLSAPDLGKHTFTVLNVNRFIADKIS